MKTSFCSFILPHGHPTSVISLGHHGIKILWAEILNWCLQPRPFPSGLPSVYLLILTCLPNNITTWTSLNSSSSCAQTSSSHSMLHIRLWQLSYWSSSGQTPVLFLRPLSVKLCLVDQVIIYASFLGLVDFYFLLSLLVPTKSEML